MYMHAMSPIFSTTNVHVVLDDISAMSIIPASSGDPQKPDTPETVLFFIRGVGNVPMTDPDEIRSLQEAWYRWQQHKMDRMTAEYDYHRFSTP